MVEARFRHIFLIAAITAGIMLSVLPGNVASKPYCERLYDSARKDYYALLKSERKQRFHDSWEKVIDKFLEIADKYPQCSRAPDAIFNVGILYRKLYRKSWLKSDLETAKDTFLELQKKYPKSKLADDALLNAAEILEELGDKESAYLKYRDLVNKYPNGDMAQKSRAKLKYLAAYAPKPKPVRTAEPKSAAARVTDVKYWANPEYSRVVVYAKGKISYEKHQLKRDAALGKPPRMYIDLKGTIPPSLCKPIPIGDGLLQQARVGQYDKDTVRLVLDIENMGDHRVFTMENPSRLIVDVMGKGGQVKASDTMAGTKYDSGTRPLPLAQQFGLGVKTIVLDPGHGGRDPGAIGPKGLKEKNVTLAVAKMIKPKLEAQGYKVLLTRDRDVYVELDQRTAYANRNYADLFVSIHTNASRSRKARGVETYFLGVARDRESSETALLENAISEQTLADLEKILLDLTRTSNLKQSSLLAESIQANLFTGLSQKHKTVKDHGVKQASFYVLIGAQMPAVLVETSFISHPTEEKLLRSRDYQALISESIYLGIIHYIDRLAKAGTGEKSS
ncbi:N-acetylmuramoyl-L-alanine amidase [bacterium]|nr:MAG: N-acetylmuramoyl-L-alanine amidase [bacterium]